MPPAVHQHRPYAANAFAVTAQPPQQQQPQLRQHNNNNNHSNVVHNSTVTLPDGRLGMIVVDPLTRKLTIPFDHIAETRAQLRHSIPSLCQLFLAGRCRQGQLCHQVHADPYVVHELRMMVERLPLCCVEHGDQDFTVGGGDGGGSVAHLIPNADRLSLRVPHLTWNNGLIAIRNLSFTQGLRQILLQHHHHATKHSDHTALPDIVDLTLSATHVNLCRLHIIDRCRFAEDCKFLHVCKSVAQQPEYLQMLASPQQQAPLQDECSSHQRAYPQLTKSEVASSSLYPLPPPPVAATAAAADASSHAAPTAQLQLLDLLPSTPSSPSSAEDDSGSASITEPSLTGSFATSASISPMITKKYRGSSWSYDPYSALGSLVAMPPPALMMAC